MRLHDPLGVHLVKGTNSRPVTQGVGVKEHTSTLTPSLKHLSWLKIRHEKGTQTQTFESAGYFSVGEGSSTWTGGGQKVRYVPRNQGNQTFWAGYPGILPGYPGGARKVWEKKSLCSIFVPYKSSKTQMKPGKNKRAVWSFFLVFKGKTFPKVQMEPKGCLKIQGGRKSARFRNP